jgi:rubredoxin
MERYANQKDWLMIEQQIRCPMCDSKARLEEYENDMYIDRIKKRIKFKMISYSCDVCTNSFTTTESDTIVVNRINKGIRCEQRKSKIKKYVP